nr:hypothetical protein [Janibacter limosus]
MSTVSSSVASIASRSAVWMARVGRSVGAVREEVVLAVLMRP